MLIWNINDKLRNGTMGIFKKMADEMMEVNIENKDNKSRLKRLFIN